MTASSACLFTRKPILTVVFLCFLSALLHPLQSVNAQSFDIPVKGNGISFGNSRDFNGLRFNFRDRYVNHIKGINCTFWYADENEDAIIDGFSIGVIPAGGDLGYIQLGIAGVEASHNLNGLSVLLLGAGAGETIQ